MYAPISSDRSRQREALIGLAIAEVSRLRHHIGRTVKISRRDGCEAAAATASVLIDTYFDDSYTDRQSSGQAGLHRSRSLSGFGYPIESYAYDDDIHSKRHRHHRHESSSPSFASSTLSPYHGTTPSSSIPVPAYGGSSPYHGGGSPYNATYNIPGGSPYMGGSSPYGAGRSSPYGAGGSSPYGAGVTAYSYEQPGLSAPPVVYGGYPASQPTTIVIEPPSSSGHRHHHHRHGSSHRHHSRRHRSRSDASYPPGYVSSSYRY